MAERFGATLGPAGPGAQAEAGGGFGGGPVAQAPEVCLTIGTRPPPPLTKQKNTRRNTVPELIGQASSPGNQQLVSVEELRE